MRNPSPLLLLALFAATLGGLGPPAASAQVVRGELVDTDGAALEGAMISLLDADGDVVTAVLSGPNGGFELTGTPGEHRIRADRIGHASTFAGPFSLSTGEIVEVRLVAAVEAIRLEGLDVEGDRRCRVRPEEGLAVARVWEEARKALAAAAWTQERGMYRFEMMKIERDLDRDGRRVLNESRSYTGGYVREPFVALPAQQLRDEGYARQNTAGMSYYAPDAAVLLSDPFLDTHCFRLDIGDDETSGLIGLAFEPVGGREVPEIEGTLWIDPETGMLRWLDYRYRNLRLPPELVTGLVGGRVEFSALPNGTWIVSSWRIQMPKPGSRVNPMSGLREDYLVGYVVSGGEVLRAHGRAGPVFDTQQGGSQIVGAVFDSLRTGGLEGAEVYALGTEARAVTRFDGRFALGGLEPGTYQVTFRHPYLDALGHVPDPLLVAVGADTTVQINFLAPPARRVLNDLCRRVERPTRPGGRPGEGVHERDAILTGRVTDTEGLPVSGATIRVLWREWSLSDPNRDNRPLVDQGRLGATATSDAGGRYRVCWVPAEIPLEVVALERMEDLDPGLVMVNQAVSPTQDSGEDRFVIASAARHGVRDLVLDRTRTGRITGTVMAAPEGTPLPGVTVTLVELGRTTTTDASGRFDFDVVPTGELSVQAEVDGAIANSGPLPVQEGGVARTELTIPSPGTDRPSAAGRGPGGGPGA